METFTASSQRLLTIASTFQDTGLLIASAGRCSSRQRRLRLREITIFVRHFPRTHGDSQWNLAWRTHLSCARMMSFPFGTRVDPDWNGCTTPSKNLHRIQHFTAAMCAFFGLPKRNLAPWSKLPAGGDSMATLSLLYRDWETKTQRGNERRGSEEVEPADATTEMQTHDSIRSSLLHSFPLAGARILLVRVSSGPLPKSLQSLCKANNDMPSTERKPVLTAFN
ncbi:hypothetical protein B0H66DRAFT_591970 [Apodospora peruviana]|uniref:Uncharacterized protein n=1 Tax=Apodospora peruviana TaxID=516989 RepID=A0AAE0I831_9PEZI|nr:hypothetical protein B0H66DRAFT_591970 [Apodospora peruviana]